MDQETLIAGIESAGRRARWTRALLLVTLALCVANLGLDWHMLDFLGRVQAGEEVSEDEAASLDQRELVLGWTAIGSYILAIVAWLSWVHRATANLRLAGTGKSRFTPGWAVGWHFVPIVGLWRAPQAMQDIGVRSTERNANAIPYVEPTPLIVAWWVAFWITRSVGRMIVRAEELDELIVAYQFSVACGLLVIVTGVLAFLVLRHLDRLQRESLVLAAPAGAGARSG